MLHLLVPVSQMSNINYKQNLSATEIFPMDAEFRTFLHNSLIQVTAHRFGWKQYITRVSQCDLAMDTSTITRPICKWYRFEPVHAIKQEHWHLQSYSNPLSGINPSRLAVVLWNHLKSVLYGIQILQRQHCYPTVIWWLKSIHMGMIWDNGISYKFTCR